MKHLYLSCCLLFSRAAFSMENATTTIEATPADALNEVYKKVALALPVAYQKLTSTQAKERSEGLRFLFNYKKEDIDHMKIVLAKGDTLTYLGAMTTFDREIFGFFQAGTFAFEPKSLLVHGQPLLVVGREVLPKSREYTELLIPADKLSEITSEDIAHTFLDSIEKAEDL